MVIRKEIIYLKENEWSFGDDGLHSLKDKQSDCNKLTVQWLRFVPFLRERENVSSFPGRRKFNRMVGSRSPSQN